MKTHITKALNLIFWIPKAYCYYSIYLGVMFFITLESSLQYNALVTGNTISTKEALFNLSIVGLVNTSKFVFGLLLIYEIQKYYRAKLKPVTQVIA
jgi:hypothetical protein